jgi:hypothetical protein
MVTAFAPIYTPEPTRCSGGPTPGALNLQDWICNRSPWRAAVTNLGIYNCRTIAGSRRLSSHASGRAGDSGVRIIPGGHPAGHELARWLVANAAVLGVQEVIWNRQRWDNQTRRWRPYTGVSPHLDHVHWALNTHGGRHLTEVRILSVAPRPAPPEPAPEPEEDDVQFIVKGDNSGEWWITDGVLKRHVNDRTEAAQLAFIGAAKWDPNYDDTAAGKGGPFIWPQLLVDDITTVPRARALT